MVAHVANDENVFKAAEETVNVSLTILVVPHVEYNHERYADEIATENVLLVSQGYNFISVLR